MTKLHSSHMLPEQSPMAIPTRTITRVAFHSPYGAVNYLIPPECG